MKERFYIDNIECQEPLNYQSVEIELNYDTDSNSQALSVSDLEFGVADGRSPIDPYLMLKRIISKGLSGGVGVTEGVPYKIELDNERGEISRIFDGYINLWQAKFENGKLNAPIQKKESIDWVNDVADAITFDYLESLGLISTNNYVRIPYCIEKKQNYLELLTVALSIFVITDKLIEQVSKLTGKSGGAQPFTATLTTTETIAIVAYISVLLVALIGLITNIFAMLIQPVKYHYGMKVKDHFDIALKYFGLKFSSSILQQQPFSDMVLLPEKYSTDFPVRFANGILSFINTEPRGKGYYSGTFGDLVRSMKLMFNAKIVISDGVFYFENQHFSLGKTPFLLPDIYDKKYEFELNYADFVSNYLYSFSIDQQDRHTIQEYKGTSVQVLQLPKITINKNLKLTKGYRELRQPFALGKPKTELSLMENMMKFLFASAQATVNSLVLIGNAIIAIINVLVAIINAIIRVLKKLLKLVGFRLNIEPVRPVPYINGVNFVNLIDDRIGMLKMESDYVAVPKLLIFDGVNRGAKLGSRNTDYLNAKYLFENYYKFDLFAQIDNTPVNQYKLQSIEKMPFLYNDYKKVLESNEIVTPSGESGYLLSLKFNPASQTASCEYKIRTVYTNNIELKYIEPDGK